MAEKNFARSGTADTDFLADDDPLSELARIVGYDPRPAPHVLVEDAPIEAPEPVAAARQQPAAFALEDELLREFELYDAPRLDPVDHIESYRAPEPVDVPAEIYPAGDDTGQATVAASPAEDFPSEAGAEPEFEAGYRSAGADEVDAADLVSAGEPQVVEPAADVPAFSADVAGWPVLGPVEPVQLDPADDARTGLPRVWTEPRFSEDPQVVAYEPVSVRDPEEHEIAARDVPADEPRGHAQGYPSHATVAHEAESRSEPVFLGFQPSDFPDIEPPSADIDLDRELELSLGSAFADEAASEDGRDMRAAALRDEPPAAASGGAGPDLADLPHDAVDPIHEEQGRDIHEERGYGEMSEPDVDAEAAVYAGLASVAYVDEPVVEEGVARSLMHPADDQAAFEPATAYAAPTVDYDPDATVTHHGSEAHAGDWHGETAEEVFHAEPSYAVTDVAPADNAFDLDDLLAEVERFPVPEPHGRSLSAETFASRDTSFATSGDAGADRPFFSRATPVARSEALAGAEPAAVEMPEPSPAETPVLAAPEEEVTPKADDLAAVDLAFENFELELDDLDLDLDPADFTVEEPEPQPAAAANAAVSMQGRGADRFIEPAPVRRQPRDEPPAVLPFDPSLIATTEEGVAPVADLNVPQLPVVEKEKPQAYASDYDFDIDAEMAQLFADPEASAHPQTAAEAEGAAPAVFPAETRSGPDEFEKALEEDFRRSMNETDRMAIPIDAGRANAPNAGEGYEDPSGRGRKILLAACAASLVLLAGIGAYAWMSGGGEATGEPRVILADNDPIKMIPKERGGKTVPNQDKAVYDRVAGQIDRGPQQEQLVTSVEEPIDVVQRTLTPETLPLEGRDDGPLDGATPVSEAESRLLPGVEQVTTEKEAESAPVITPRKVRTMIVKPDGTLVAREEIEPEPSGEAASSDMAEGGETAARLAAPTSGTVDADASVADTNPAALDGAASTTANADTAGATTPLEEVASANIDETAPVRVVRTTTIGANDTADNTPVPESRPADQPVSVVGTVTDQGNVRDGQTAEADTAATTQTAAETRVAAANPGGYVIQIASLPSEAEAQRSYDNLSARFAGVIGGRGVDIRRADIPNKGIYYRVRIPAGSREEANALCSRYKSAGGSCLVTR